MEKKLIKFAYFGLGIAVIGLFLSFFLILEFYGSSGTIGSSLCNAISDHESCKQVAESPYSAIRIPNILEIPVAAIGFAYYGAMGFGFWNLSKSNDIKTFKTRINLLIPFSALGIMVDFILLLISLFLIGKICSLCLLTYFVTISLFIVSFMGSKKLLNIEGDSIVKAFKESFLNYFLVFLGFLIFGYVVGNSLSSRPKSIDNSNRLVESFQSFEAQPIIDVDTSGAASIGKSNAPITIIKFADYNCGHCMNTSHILDQILREFDGMVKVVYMNFPLDGNCNPLVGRNQPGASSCIAASAAICANYQNKFSEMHHALFKDNENGTFHSTATVLNHAEKYGLNMQNFKSCMSSDKVRNQIQKEVEEAGKLKIQSTPTLMVNGRLLTPGTPDPRYLKSLLRYLIETM